MKLHYHTTSRRKHSRSTLGPQSQCNRPTKHEDHDSCSGNDGTSFQGTVNDTTMGSATGAVDTKRPAVLPFETGSTKSILIPKPHSDGRHNSKMVCFVKGWIADRSRHHRCQAEALSKNSTCRISTVFCTVSTVGTRLCTHNRNVHHTVDELELGHLHVLERHGLLGLVADDRRDVHNQEIHPPPPPQPHLKSSAPHPTTALKSSGNDGGYSQLHRAQAPP